METDISLLGGSEVMPGTNSATKRPQRTNNIGITNCHIMATQKRTEFMKRFRKMARNCWNQSIMPVLISIHRKEKAIVYQENTIILKN